MNFEILQLKDKDVNYKFMSYEYACKNGLCINDYESIYKFTDEALLQGKELKVEEALEIIFRQFNRVTQEDVERLDFIGFKGHSISVSDVVKVDNDYWYCDSFGWVKIDKDIFYL